MKDLSNKISPYESMSMYAIASGDGYHESMREFLIWLEEYKGLTLCHAFKPQFDWYMPALANKEALVHEFLGSNKSHVLRKTHLEHMS